MSTEQSDFRLGVWTVRPQRCLIERGSESVRVKPKSMAVLECLARANGGVTSRDALFDAVWPGAIVTDDVLTHSIVELRKAFDESARDAQIIETIPKKGFRLVPEVKPVRAGKNSGKLRFSMPQLIGLVVALVSMALIWDRIDSQSARPGSNISEAKSIAILPFVDMSPDKDQGYFADGLAEELINRLTQLQGLQVTARTSSFFFKETNDDLRVIGEMLGVNHLLEGSVRKSESEFRITAQLIEVSSGFHLWSETFDRPIEDIFAVQEELAEAVARALSIKLSVGELGSVVGGTKIVDAFDQVLLGNSLFGKFDAESMLQAAEHYKRATEIDPNFALAWAGLADVYRRTRLVLAEQDYQTYLQQSEVALAEATKLAPMAPYILRQAADAYIDAGRWADADAKLSLAEELDSRAATTGVHVDLLAKTGRISDAIAMMERSRRMDPLSATAAMYLGHLYTSQGDYEKALSELDRGYELGGSLPLISVEGMVAALHTGDLAIARIWLGRAIEHGQPGARGVHDEMAQRLGDRESALSWLNDAFESSSIADYYTAIWASFYDDTALAVRALQRSPDPWAFWLPLMSDVRRLPEFRDLIRDMGLESYWREFGWSDYCHAIEIDDFECR